MVKERRGEQELRQMMLAAARKHEECSELEDLFIKLSKEARVPDMSETVTTGEEAEKRILDLKEKARME